MSDAVTKKAELERTLHKLAGKIHRLHCPFEVHDGWCVDDTTRIAKILRPYLRAASQEGK